MEVPQVTNYSITALPAPPLVVPPGALVFVRGLLVSAALDYDRAAYTITFHAGVVNAGDRITVVTFIP